jgi:hypothetical protein
MDSQKASHGSDQGISDITANTAMFVGGMPAM